MMEKMKFSQNFDQNTEIFKSVSKLAKDVNLNLFKEVENNEVNHRIWIFFYRYTL